MPLDKQNVVINLGELGLDKGKHPHIAKGLLSAENVTFTQDGALRKRTGTKILTPDDIGLDSPHVGDVDGVPYTIGDNLFVYSELSPDAGYSGSVVDSGIYGNLLDIAVEKISSSQYYVDKYCDYAESGSIYAIIFTYALYVTGAGSARYYDIGIATYEKATNRLLASKSLYGALVGNDFVYGRLVALTQTSGEETTDVIMYYYIYDSTIYYGTINVDTGAIGDGAEMDWLENTPVTSQDGNVFDACRVVDGDGLEYAVISYIADDNKLYTISALNGTSAGEDVVTSDQAADVKRVCVSPSGSSDDSIIVAWSSSVETSELLLRAVEYDSALTVTSAESSRAFSTGNYADILQIASCATSSGANVYCSLSEATSNPTTARTAVAKLAHSGTLGTATLIAQGGMLATKPTTYNSNSHLLVGITWADLSVNLTDQDLDHDIKDVRCVFVDENDKVSGQVLPGIVRRNVASYALVANYLPSITAIDTDSLATVLTFLKRNNMTHGTIGDSDVCLPAIVRITHGATPSIHGQSRVSVIGGNICYSFDGSTLFEGFLRYPEVYAVEDDEGDVDNILAGTYQYKALYEFIDAKGNIHRSAPSVTSSTVVHTGAHPTKIEVPRHWYISRARGVRAIIYRTTDGGTVFYRLGSMSADYDDAYDTLVATYYDDVEDTRIVTAETLYTDSGELDNIAPYPMLDMAQHQDRMVYAAAEAPSTDVYYSKKTTPGEPVCFNDSLLCRVPEAGGNIVALASHGDRLYVLKRRAIYMLDGQGVDNYGSGYSYRQPAMLVDPMIGCTSKRSVVVTARGVMFWGDDNIYLLNGMEIQPAGDAVTEYMGYTPTGASLLQDRGCVVWTMRDLDEALVYDIHTGRWVTWTNHKAGSSRAIASVLYRVVGTITHRLAADDLTHYYDTDIVEDTLTRSHIKMRVTTPWLTFAGIKGFQRIFREFVLGQNISAHTLKCRTGYDFDPGWEDSQTYATSALTAFGHAQYYAETPTPSTDDQALIVAFAGSRQKCHAIRFEISDPIYQTESWSTADPPVLTMVDEDPPTEHMSLTSLACLIGIKRGGQPPRGRKAS